MNKVKLRDILVDHFNSSELHNLCFDLDIKHESIAGNTIEDKARELIEYCFRRGRLEELVNRCRELRPNTDWSEFVAVEPKVGSVHSDQKQMPQRRSYDDSQIQSDPIRITGIIIEGVTQPRNDGTRGSALYTVPLQLSRRPSEEWAGLFVQTWDRPPRFTTMHRPRIASVSGDRIILSGTTMREIEDYHLDTLKLVVERVNALSLELEKANQKRAEENERKAQEHRSEVRDIGNRLKFD